MIVEVINWPVLLGPYNQCVLYVAAEGQRPNHKICDSSQKSPTEGVKNTHLFLYHLEGKGVCLAIALGQTHQTADRKTIIVDFSLRFHQSDRKPKSAIAWYCNFRFQFTVPSPAWFQSRFPPHCPSRVLVRTIQSCRSLSSLHPTSSSTASPSSLHFRRPVPPTHSNAHVLLIHIDFQPTFETVNVGCLSPDAPVLNIFRKDRN